MSEDDPEEPMTLEDAVSSAQDIVDQLRARWKESGLPVEVLAHAMIGAGITDLTNERNTQRPRMPLGVIHPCRPYPSSRPVATAGWHEVKHDGYRLQVHAGTGRVRPYTMNGADWTDRYPLIVEETRQIKITAVIDAEVICTDKDGRADFSLRLANPSWVVLSPPARSPPQTCAISPGLNCRRSLPDTWRSRWLSPF